MTDTSTSLWQRLRIK